MVTPCHVTHVSARTRVPRFAQEFAGDKPIGDPDLYLTNRNGGAGPLSRDAFVWKSTNVGADRIDVHPDDPLAMGASTYLIGVLGYADRNRWTLR